MNVRKKLIYATSFVLTLLVATPVSVREAIS